MHSPILLETERLTLRTITPDDAEDIYSQLSDPEVMRYYPDMSAKEDREKWLQGILADHRKNGFGMLAVRLKETGEFVGQAGIMYRPTDECDCYYLAYILCKRFWGRGYATEAVQALLDYGFETLGARKVTALIRPDNARSIRLAERLGMRYESETEHGGTEHRVYTLTR